MINRRNILKIKYLSKEDKQTLKALKQTENIEEIACILETFLSNQPTLHTMWEYRKWLGMLTEEQFRNRPILVCGVIQIDILGGRLKEAKQLAEKFLGDDVYGRMSMLILPNIDDAEREAALLKLSQSKNFAGKNMFLTASRPSILNGLWDLTPNASSLHEEKEKVMYQLEQVFGELAPYIFQIACAESLYYQDKCYEALVMIVGLMPFLRERHDMQFLFVALTLEVFIMVQNGQTPSTVPMMENLRKQIKEKGMEEYLPNIDALDAWAAMYDGDYVRMTKWMREGAPDEYAKFCMLDLFRYMIKMRGYIIQGKYLAVTNLATKLLPILKEGKRYMDMCELHMLWAMSDYAAGRSKEAFIHLEEAIKLSEKYHYDRLIADEGRRMLELLKAYRTEKTKSQYLSWLTELTEKSASLFPRYLKGQLPEMPALTEAEMRILRLLQENYTNAEIGEAAGIAVETVKKHCKHIIAKLEVKNRHQAVQRAVEYGILEPI